MTTPTFNPGQAYFYGTFVELAYQMYLAQPGDLTPPLPPASQRFWPADYQIVLYLNAIDRFSDESERKFFGFVAQSKSSPDEFVIAIRGTEFLIEWLIDAEFWPTRFTPVPDAGEVEDGFFSIYSTFAWVLPDGTPFDVHSFIQDKASGANFTVVGHSLGAAMANMLALDVAVNDPVSSLTLYTLASPRTGSGAFAASFAAHVPNTFRVYNEPDIVPKLPPLYDPVGVACEIDSKQFSNIKHSIGCYHALVTYLWVLNQQSEFSLQLAGCQSTGAPSVSSEKPGVPL